MNQPNTPFQTTEYSITAKEKLEFLLKELVSQTSNGNSDNLEGLWKKIRFVFLDLSNQQIHLEATPELKKLILKIRTYDNFISYLSDMQIISVFPKMELPMNKVTSPRICRISPKVHEPNQPTSKTPRPKINLETPSITLSPKSQESSFSHSARLTTTTSIIPNQVQDQSTAFIHIASNDSQHDFLQFHYGTCEKSHPYDFSLQSHVTNDPSYQVIGHRGVFSGNENGQSEFSSLNTFLEDKTDFHLAAPLPFFKNFWIIKYFSLWKFYLSQRQFNHMLSILLTKTWQNQDLFPTTMLNFRTKLYSLNSIQSFPLKVQYKLKFPKFIDDLVTGAQFLKKEFKRTSQELRSLLDSLAEKILSDYDYITSPKATDLLLLDKIPSELFYRCKMPFKRGLSIVEEKEASKILQNKINKAKKRVDSISPFYILCDKMVKKFYLEMITEQFSIFSDTFTNSSHQVLFYTIPEYKNGKIQLNPSCQDVINGIETHLLSVYKALHKFIRPAYINTHFILEDGKIDKKVLKAPIDYSQFDSKDSLDNFISTSTLFSSDLKNLKDTICDSFKKVNLFLSQYTPMILSIYKFQENWSHMKETDSNPITYVDNFEVLDRMKEAVQSYRGDSFFDLVEFDMITMKNELQDIIHFLYQDNTQVLLQQFENVCKKIQHECKSQEKALDIIPTTLDEWAQYNSQLVQSKVQMPKIEDNLKVMQSIYMHSLKFVPLVAATLMTSAEETKGYFSKLEKKIEDAQSLIDKMKEKNIAQMKQQENLLKDRIKEIEAIVSSVPRTQEAADKYSQANDQLDEIQKDVDHFLDSSKDFGYESSDFGEVNVIRRKLVHGLNEWSRYSSFMNEIKELKSSLLSTEDFKSQMNFISKEKKRTQFLMKQKTILNKRILNAYNDFSKYLPLFAIFNTVQPNESLWRSLFTYFGLDETTFPTATVETIMQPMFLDRMEDIQSFLNDTQQKGFLLDSFSTLTNQLKEIKLEIIDSSYNSHGIISFWSLHLVISTCESLLVHMQTMQSIQLSPELEKDIISWNKKAMELSKILNALQLFQTEYVNLKTITEHSSDELQYSGELEQIAYIDQWFGQFIGQVKFEPDLFDLLSKENPENSENPEPSFQNGVIIFPKNTILVNHSLHLPIPKFEEQYYQGSLLLDCLQEGYDRCCKIFSSLSDLLESQRAAYPRLYFCTNQQLLNIYFAMEKPSVVNFDLTPIFPGIASFKTYPISHKETTETAKFSEFEDESSPVVELEVIESIISITGEKFKLKDPITIKKGYLPQTLKLIEEKMKETVIDMITEASIKQDSMPLMDWVLAYPSQIIFVAEALNFSGLKPDCFPYYEAKVTSKIQHMKALLTTNPQFSSIIAQILRQNDYIVNYSKKQNKFMMHYNLSMENKLYVQCGDISIPYGAEILPKLETPPMTDEEDLAAYGMAHCFTHPEFSFCNVMNHFNSLIFEQSFSSFCGLPIFESNSILSLRSIIAAATSIPAIYKIKDFSSDSACFHSFYEILESFGKNMKLDYHFIELERSKWNSLFIVETQKIPEWLTHRLRPIHLAPVAPSSIVSELFKVCKQKLYKTSLSICNESDTQSISSQKETNYDDSETKSLSNSDIQNDNFIDDNKDNISTTSEEEFDVYFDTAEFLLSNTLVKTALQKVILNEKYLNIIHLLSQRINSLNLTHDLWVHDFPPTQMQDQIQIICENMHFALFSIYLACGHILSKIQETLISLTDDSAVILLKGYRSVLIKITSTNDSTIPVVNMEKSWQIFQIPMISNQEIVKIILQQSSYAIFRKPEKMSRFDYSDLNKIRYQLLLFRVIQKTNPLLHDDEIVGTIGSMYSMTDLVKNECSQNLVIIAPTQSGKREFVKNFINSTQKQGDIVLYSSPFNNDISLTVLNHLLPLTHQIYAPELRNRLFIVIYDIQDASDYMKKFIRDLLEFRSIFSESLNRYLKVKNVQLILTVNNKENFESFKFKAPIQVINESYNTFKFVKKLDFKKKLKDYPLVIQKIEDNHFYSRVKLIKNDFDFNELDLIMADQNKELSVDQFIKSRINCFVISDDFEAIEMNIDKQKTHIVVLDNRGRTQLFQGLTAIAQTGYYGLFIVDLNILEKDEALNLIEFFSFSSSIPSFSSVLEKSDIQILKYYSNPRLTDEAAFEQLISKVSALFICSPQKFDSIPLRLKLKIPSINPSLYSNKESKFGSILVPTDNEIPDIIKEFVNPLKYKAQYQKAEQRILSKFNILKSMITISSDSLNQIVSIPLPKFGENELRNTKEIQSDLINIEAQINDIKNLLEKKQKSIDEITSQCKERDSIIEQALSDFNTFKQEDEISAIDSFVQSKSVYIHLLCQFLHFGNPCLFTDAGGLSQHCRLIQSIFSYTKKNEQTQDEIELPSDSIQTENCIIKTIIEWLKASIERQNLSIKEKEILSEYENNDSKLKSLQDQMTELTNELEESEKTAVKQEEIGQTPDWFKQEWLLHSKSMTEFMEKLENPSKIMLEMKNIIKNLNDKIPKYAALEAAFNSGLESQPFCIRKRVIDYFQLEELYDIHKFVQHRFESIIFFPVPPFPTFIQYNCFDLAIFGQIKPFTLLYDPQDIAFNCLLTICPDAKMLYSSESTTSIINGIFKAMVEGDTLICYLIDPESGTNLINCYKHFVLESLLNEKIGLEGNHDHFINSEFRLFFLSKYKTLDEKFEINFEEGLKKLENLASCKNDNPEDSEEPKSNKHLDGMVNFDIGKVVPDMAMIFASDNNYEIDVKEKVKTIINATNKLLVTLKQLSNACTGPVSIVFKRGMSLLEPSLAVVSDYSEIERLSLQTKFDFELPDPQAFVKKCHELGKYINEEQVLTSIQRHGTDFPSIVIEAAISSKFSLRKILCEKFNLSLSSTPPGFFLSPNYSDIPSNSPIITHKVVPPKNKENESNKRPNENSEKKEDKTDQNEEINGSPICIEVNDNLSTDFVCKAISKRELEKGKPFLTVGSFSGETLKDPDSVVNLIAMCKKLNGGMILVLGNQLPSYVEFALHVARKKLSFNDYFIIGKNKDIKEFRAKNQRGYVFCKMWNVESVSSGHNLLTPCEIYRKAASRHGIPLMYLLLNLVQIPEFNEFIKLEYVSWLALEWSVEQRKEGVERRIAEWSSMVENEKIRKILEKLLKDLYLQDPPKIPGEKIATFNDEKLSKSYDSVKVDLYMNI